MNTRADKGQENQSRAVAVRPSAKANSRQSPFQFVDNRPEVAAQRKLQQVANSSSHVKRLHAYREKTSRAESLDGMRVSVALKCNERLSQGKGGNVIQRFGVAISPKYLGGQWIIDKIIIDGRPPGPSTVGWPQHGGASFHHETAWFIEEFNIAKRWEGQPIDVAYGYLRRQGVVPAVRDENDLMQMQVTLTRYFEEALKQAASNAPGHLGSPLTHAVQGGDINAKLTALRNAIQQQDEQELTKAAVYIYVSTYEEDPGLGGMPMAVKQTRLNHMAKVSEYLVNNGLDPETEVARAESIVKEYWGLG